MKNFVEGPKFISIKPLLIIIWFAIFQSCSNNEVDTIDPDTYLPLEIGKYQIYEVTETSYTISNTNSVTKTWQEKDILTRVIKEQNNNITYLVERYQRASPNEHFQKTKEYTISKSPDKVITTIDNESIVSLVLPPDGKVRWNGNLYNLNNETRYWYTDINMPSQINNLKFDKTITVFERNDSTAINNYKGIKKYAAGIGLISDEQVAYEYCQETGCLGTGKIDEGFYRLKRIIESN